MISSVQVAFTAFYCLLLRMIQKFERPVETFAYDAGLLQALLTLFRLASDPI